jgi:hypothetical protein
VPARRLQVGLTLPLCPQRPTHLGACAAVLGDTVDLADGAVLPPHEITEVAPARGRHDRAVHLGSRQPDRKDPAARPALVRRLAARVRRRHRGRYDPRSRPSTHDLRGREELGTYPLDHRLRHRARAQLPVSPRDDVQDEMPQRAVGSDQCRRQVTAECQVDGGPGHRGHAQAVPAHDVLVRQSRRVHLQAGIESLGPPERVMWTSDEAVRGVQSGGEPARGQQVLPDHGPRPRASTSRSTLSTERDGQPCRNRAAF